jgi:hypothetical protein
VTALASLYVRFEAFIGWKLPSADEALLREDLDPMTRAWLEQFVEEWDEATKWERRCAEENERDDLEVRITKAGAEVAANDPAKAEDLEILRHELGVEIAERDRLE